MTRPKVVIAGQEYPTSVVKEGSFEGTDLTLLSIEETLLPMRLRLRQNTLCKEPPRPGQQVVTVIPEAVVHSHILAPARIPVSVRRFSTVIADVAQTGNSGSGVFDAQHRCLLGNYEPQNLAIANSDRTPERPKLTISPNTSCRRPKLRPSCRQICRCNLDQ